MDLRRVFHAATNDLAFDRGITVTKDGTEVTFADINEMADGLARAFPGETEIEFDRLEITAASDPDGRQARSVSIAVGPSGVDGEIRGADRDWVTGRREAVVKKLAQTRPRGPVPRASALVQITVAMAALMGIVSLYLLAIKITASAVWLCTVLGFSCAASGALIGLWSARRGKTTVRLVIPERPSAGESWWRISLHGTITIFIMAATLALGICTAVQNHAAPVSGPPVRQTHTPLSTPSPTKSRR